MSEELLTAKELARRLLHPTSLDYALTSGVFVESSSPQEASLFMEDLAKDLKNCNVAVLRIHAKDLILPDAQAHLIAKLRTLSSDEGAHLESDCDVTPANLAARILRRRNVIAAMLIDEAEALLGEAGERSMKALKSVRDAVNLASAGSEQLLLVATCVWPSSAKSFVFDSAQAFYGATAIVGRL